MLAVKHAVNARAGNAPVFSAANAKAMPPEFFAPEARCAVVIVEGSDCLRDRLTRSLAHHWSGPVTGCGDLSRLSENRSADIPTVVLLSVLSLTDEEADARIASLAHIDPSVRSIVLARADGLDEALNALDHGANGYISTSAGFAAFVEALRFVAAGGDYLPDQCPDGSPGAIAPAYLLRDGAMKAVAIGH